MPRNAHQYWFCLAAVCLGGSLMLLCSSDIEIAEEVATSPPPFPHTAIFRRLEELPTTSGYGDEAELPVRLDRMPFEGQHGEQRILAPAGVPGRHASPLNSTARVLPAGFQSNVSSPVSEPVWLSGKIETLETVR